MSEDDNNEQYNKYLEDPRIPCHYGVKCYQKNPMHHNKYKHPPKDEQQKNKKKMKNVRTGQKRKANDESVLPKTPSTSPHVQHMDKKQNQDQNEDSFPECSSSPDKNSEEMNSRTCKESFKDYSKHEISPSPEKEIEKLESGISGKELETKNLISNDAREIINKLFLTEMPEDFYQFYDFCKECSKKDPLLAFKIVDIKLVGPFDVMEGKFSKFEYQDKYLRHWRYFYDPPEFQTVLKGNDKDGLHFGYWRDEPGEMPIFLAKNNANVSCKIVPVAENLFGAVDSYLEERTKLANPFEKMTITRLHQKLKTFAKERQINLEKHTSGMKERERKVVARTFHGAGIVVPYDRKTGVGYRKLSVSEANLRTILERIQEEKSDKERKLPISDLQEIIRWATIAADECDFGTCLELGHDLFSSGVNQVNDMALQMLSTAYSLLNRSEFLNIATSHLRERKRGSSLSVI